MSRGAVQTQAFLHDRDANETGIFDEPGGIMTTRVSVDDAGNQRSRASSNGSVSGDGEYVAFQGNKSSGKSDILVWAANTTTSTLLSINAFFGSGNGDSENPELSRGPLAN